MRRWREFIVLHVAQHECERRGLEDRRKAVQCVRDICSKQAEQLGREELEETKIGRLEHKIEKLKVIADRIPGVEFLRTDAFSGENGIALQEYAPFGVIGAITPVTHSLPTLAGNAINMLAAGNAVVFNPHPSGAKIAVKGTRLFNQAIHNAIGIDNLLTIIEKPTLESAQAIFDHRDVRMLCVTGGPAVGRAAMRSPKRAIVAGPGNPPVVVDETADLDRAARSIVAGAAYDNNLLCIGEKEVFAVASIFDELMEAMTRYKAVRLDRNQIDALTTISARLRRRRHRRPASRPRPTSIRTTPRICGTSFTPRRRASVPWMSTPCSRLPNGSRNVADSRGSGKGWSTGWRNADNYTAMAVSLKKGIEPVPGTAFDSAIAAEADVLDVHGEDGTLPRLPTAS